MSFQLNSGLDYLQRRVKESCQFVSATNIIFQYSQQMVLEFKINYPGGHHWETMRVLNKHVFSYTTAETCIKALQARHSVLLKKADKNRFKCPENYKLTIFHGGQWLRMNGTFHDLTDTSAVKDHQDERIWDWCNTYPAIVRAISDYQERIGRDYYGVRIEYAIIPLDTYREWLTQSYKTSQDFLIVLQEHLGIYFDNPDFTIFPFSDIDGTRTKNVLERYNIEPKSIRDKVVFITSNKEES